MKNHICRSLFMTFFKIGLFTFGGGYAMIPLIKREVTEHHEWLTDEEMFDIIAIAESTPGPLAINTATFVGSKLCGLKGALSATLGVISPSFLIILAISQLLLQIERYELVQNAFLGIRAGVLVLITNALISLLSHMKRSVFTFTLLVSALFLRLIAQIDTIIILVICAVAGIVWSCYMERKGLV